MWLIGEGTHQGPQRRGDFCQPQTGRGCWDFITIICWFITGQHPTDLCGAKTLLRDPVCELALEKGDGDVAGPDGQVLGEALSSGLWNLPAGPGAIPSGPCSPVERNLAGFGM